MSMHWPNFPRSGAQVPYGTFMTPLGLLPAYMGVRIAALVLSICIFFPIALFVPQCSQEQCLGKQEWYGGIWKAAWAKRWQRSPGGLIGDAH